MIWYIYVGKIDLVYIANKDLVYIGNIDLVYRANINLVYIANIDLQYACIMFSSQELPSLLCILAYLHFCIRMLCF